MKKRTGFTLIELLVVIAIIAILAAVAIIQFGNAQADARDSRRQADARAMQSALELEYNASNAYPAVISWTSLMNNLGDYLPSVIQDPDDTAQSFFYCKSAQNENYVLGVTLEGQEDVSGDVDTLAATWTVLDTCIYEDDTAETANNIDCSDGAGTGTTYFCLGDSNDS